MEEMKCNLTHTLFTSQTFVESNGQSQTGEKSLIFQREKIQHETVSTTVLLFKVILLI